MQGYFPSQIIDILRASGEWPIELTSLGPTVACASSIRATDISLSMSENT